MLRYVCGSSCGTFMINIFVTLRSFTSWKIQPPVTGQPALTDTHSPNISSLMRWISVLAFIYIKHFTIFYILQFKYIFIDPLPKSITSISMFTLQERRRNFLSQG